MGITRKIYKPKGTNRKIYKPKGTNRKTKFLLENYKIV